MNGHDVTGAGLIKGGTGDFTNLTATGLTLGGNTGKTSAQAYDAWVINAKNAENAIYANSAGNANTLGGKTLSNIYAYIDDNAGSSGPAGILGATSITNRQSGNTTLSVVKNRWYKIDIRGGNGAEVSTNGGFGARAVFSLKAGKDEKWSILFHLPAYWGGGAVEVKDSSGVVIAILGGGGCGSSVGGSPGNAGVPLMSGGAAKGGDGGTSTYVSPGGAAVSGTRVCPDGVQRGGAGYSTGMSNAQFPGLAGGGGSSYINSSYGGSSIVHIESVGLLSNNTGRQGAITIWEYK